MATFNINKKNQFELLYAFKRVGKYLNRLGKLTIYHSFILSNFNYCPVTLHFCNEQNTKKMEKIQERALKFTYENQNSTYEELLKRFTVAIVIWVASTEYLCHGCVPFFIIITNVASSNPAYDNVESSTPRISRIRTRNISGDRNGWHR